MLIIDATGCAIGRVGTVAAKQALLGETVAVINCKDAIITGTKKNVLGEWKRFQIMGVPRKGPYIHRLPDRFAKRIIRGMLPYKKPRGAEALKRITCYINTKDLKGTMVAVPKSRATKFMTIGSICKELGGKHGEE